MNREEEGVVGGRGGFVNMECVSGIPPKTGTGWKFQVFTSSQTSS